MPKRHLQKRAQTVRTLLKSLSANYRNGCPHITEKGVRELVKPAYGRKIWSHLKRCAQLFCCKRAPFEVAMASRSSSRM